MRGENGALVAIDPQHRRHPRDGAHPAFDPDIFAGGVKSSAWRELITDPSHPLENRVIQGIYPPGSTFKVVDTIAGLKEGTLTDTDYNCPGGIWFGGREYRCWRKQGHGNYRAARAIVESCDVYFYDVGEQLGVDRIASGPICWASAKRPASTSITKRPAPSRRPHGSRVGSTSDGIPRRRSRSPSGRVTSRPLRCSWRSSRPKSPTAASATSPSSSSRSRPSTAASPRPIRRSSRIGRGSIRRCSQDAQRDG